MQSPALHGQRQSPTRRTRSPICSPSVSPGSPLRAEFNASLNSSSEKSTTSPRQHPAREDREPSSEPLWMDKMMHMLSETHMALASGISSSQAPRGILGLPEMNTIVGPALPRLPSTVSATDSASPSPQLPFSAPQLLPNRARNVGGENESIFSTGLPTLTTNQHAAKKRGLGAKIVLEERTIRALCGPGHSGDFADTAPVPTCAKNKAFQMDTRLLAVGDWRGPLAASRGSRVYRIANSVIAAAYRMAMCEQSAKSELLDRDWKLNGQALHELLDGAVSRDHPSDRTNVSGQVMSKNSIEMFMSQQRSDALELLANHCKSIVSTQPTLVRIQAPAKVFGDIHGQFRDLLLLFARFGFPTHRGGDIETTTYIFNGDWIDRGRHQLETVLLLMALKSLYPSRVFLIRGNHEFKETSENQHKDSFQENVSWLLPPPHASRVYSSIFDMFEYLPLGALISEKMLVIHGGLGDGTWGLRELQHCIPRPLVSAGESFIKQCLWSDPSDSDAEMARGVHGNPRGDGVATFGPDVTERFCERENLDLIIRSHQFVPEGYKIMHSGHLITLFSARDYLEQNSRQPVSLAQRNNAAMLLAAQDESGAVRVRFKVLRCIEKIV